MRTIILAALLAAASTAALAADASSIRAEGLQQRIEARQQRHALERAESQRMLYMQDRNTRRLEREIMQKQLGVAAVAVGDWMNSITVEDATDW